VGGSGSGLGGGLGVGVGSGLGSGCRGYPKAEGNCRETPAVLLRQRHTHVDGRLQAHIAVSGYVILDEFMESSSSGLHKQ
jgi:hypothetical protein